jgi:hypothetical protein
MFMFNVHTMFCVVFCAAAHQGSVGMMQGSTVQENRNRRKALYGRMLLDSDVDSSTALWCVALCAMHCSRGL